MKIFSRNRRNLEKDSMNRPVECVLEYLDRFHGGSWFYNPDMDRYEDSVSMRRKMPYEINYRD